MNNDRDGKNQLFLQWHCSHGWNQLCRPSCKCKIFGLMFHLIETARLVFWLSLIEYEYWIWRWPYLAILAASPALQASAAALFMLLTAAQLRHSDTVAWTWKRDWWTPQGNPKNTPCLPKPHKTSHIRFVQIYVTGIPNILMVFFSMILGAKLWNQEFCLWMKNDKNLAEGHEAEDDAGRQWECWSKLHSFLSILSFLLLKSEVLSSLQFCCCSYNMALSAQ